MLISHTGYDVTPFIVLDKETDPSWEFKIKEMFTFIRNIPEYKYLLNKYLFEQGLTTLIYVTSSELEEFMPILLESSSNQNSNRKNRLGFCVDGAPIIVLDLLTIMQDHVECKQYMPKGIPYITIEELVFDVLCHEITHLFQNQSMYTKNNESIYMESECEDFMYTVIFNNFDKMYNPYISKDGYLYGLYKKKLKKYVTDFEYPTKAVLSHHMVYQLFTIGDSISIKHVDVKMFSNIFDNRAKLGVSLLMALVVIGSENAYMFSSTLNNNTIFVYDAFDIDVLLTLEIFNFVYTGLGYSANKKMIEPFITELIASNPKDIKLIESFDIG